MIKSQRKRHLQIWLLWAILIPVGIIVAWMAVPKKVTQELLQKETLGKESKIIASVDKENYKINILFDSAFLVEFINKKALHIPSLLLYQVIDSNTNDVDRQELLGRIQGKGTQYFPLSMIYNPSGDIKLYLSKKFILYDIIKKQTIDSLKFPL